ncbi:hypothetical protein Ddc_24410 [Ditylenchus destructor]|nr:hypothetical protein Ddc_24410 [Ditylenchus destructor]
MTTSAFERLPTEMVSSALTFLTRPQLLRLTTVSCCVQTVLQEDFSGKPFLFLDELEKNSYWTINEDYCRIEQFIEHLIKSKFIRFNSVDLLWAALRNEVQHLKEISHVCIDTELRIKSFNAKKDQAIDSLMPLVYNCKRLYLLGYHAIQLLPLISPSYNLPSVRCKIFYGYGVCNNSADIPGICLEAIMEFLFSPMNGNKPRELSICDSISNQDAIVNALKKKFLEAKTHVAFTLQWVIAAHNNGAPFFSTATNLITNQKLRIKSSLGFYTIDVYDL